MGKKIKEKYTGARVDDAYFATVLAYIEAAEMTQGDLVRAALDEYMQNHPIKDLPNASPATEVVNNELKGAK